MAIAFSVAVAYLLKCAFIQLIKHILLTRRNFILRRVSSFSHTFSEAEPLASGSLLNPIKMTLALISVSTVASHVFTLYWFWHKVEIFHMVYKNVYSFTTIFILMTFIGWLPVRLGHVFLDNEKIVVPKLFTTSNYLRSDTAVFLRKISNNLYACLVVRGRESDVLFVDPKSARIISLWASSDD